MDSLHLERTLAALTKCHSTREMRSTLDEILARDWAVFHQLDQPGALERDLARLGQYPPTRAEVDAWVSRPKTPRRGGATVYFISGGGLIKIGCSDDPDERLSSLQTGSPVPLRIVATLDGGYDLERTLHRRFAAHRSHGEWFHIADEIVAFLSDTTGGCDR